LKKYVIFILYLFIINYLFCQQVVLSINREKERNHGISVKLNQNQEIKSIFEKLEIINISKNDNDSRNFGKYVEMEKDLEYDFKGEVIKDKLYIIYSNLSNISVNIGEIANNGTIIGYGGGSGTNAHNKTSDFYLYIYTKTFSPFLNLKTKNQFFEEDGIFWWNPQFIFQE